MMQTSSSNILSLFAISNWETSGMHYHLHPCKSYMYSIDLKIVIFPCARDFCFFEIIGLVIFFEPSYLSQKARIHTYSSSKSSV